MNDIQQYLRQDCCEVTGLPVVHGENTNDLGVDLGGISDNNIYISECLTGKNRVLEEECLKFRRDYKFKYIWTNQGRIYMRRDKDSPSKIISCQADLEGLLK